jgi:hypothetical protein
MPVGSPRMGSEDVQNDTVDVVLFGPAVQQRAFAQHKGFLAL